MATNLWERFCDTLPGDPKIIAEVISVSGTESVVETSSGGRMRVSGSGYASGAMVWVKGGAIVGAAPSLPHAELEI